MKNLGLNLTAPACLVIALCGYAMILGADPAVILKYIAIGLPITGHVVFSIFTVLYAMQIGDIGVQREMSLQGRLYYYHGMAVILAMVLAAAGSYILLFAKLIGGLTGGAV
jgi:hypothetical protein